MEKENTKKKVEEELLKREVEELSQLIESNCTTIPDAEKFLKTNVERIHFKTWKGEEIKLFIARINNNNPLGNIFTIYFYQDSLFYYMEVTGSNPRNKCSEDLTIKTAENLKEAVSSIISNPQDNPNIDIYRSK